MERQIRNSAGKFPIGPAQSTISNIGKTKVDEKEPVFKPKAAPKMKKLKKQKKSKPKSDLAKWLAGDTTYQQQIADFNRSRSDYQSQYQRQYGIVGRDYNETQRALNRQGTQDRVAQQNDFAGRGILRSGVFAKALGDYNTEYNQRMKSLVTGQSDKVGDLNEQRNSFLRQLQLELNSAKQDAIRRRAQKLGI